MNKLEIKNAIHNGTPIKCSKKEYPKVRKILHEIASEYIEINDAIRAQIALEEIRRLDKSKMSFF